MNRYFASVLLSLPLLFGGGCGSETAAPLPPGADAGLTQDGRQGPQGSDRPAALDAPAAEAGSAADGPSTVVGGDGGGAARDSGPPAADLGTGSDAAAPAWPEVMDYGARGPYQVTRQSNTGPGGGYEMFRPSQLGAEGRKHPIISWANGTLFGIADYQRLLEHWASHGFVVIAGRTNSTAGGGTHKAGIDWLVGENARAGSPLEGVLDPARIGAAGHSQGGGATIAAGSNKPGPTGIVATVPLMPILSFETDRTIVTRQMAPMLNINADTDDRDPNGNVPRQIYQGNPGTTAKLVQAAFDGIHEDAMNAAMWKPTLAWFRLHLMGDTRARELFYPPGTCGLCQDPAWPEVRHRP